MSPVKCRLLMQLCPFATSPRCYCRGHVKSSSGKFQKTLNAITTRQKKSDSDDKCARTKDYVFGKDLSYLHDYAILHTDHIIPNQAQKIVEGTKKVLDKIQQRVKQSQEDDIIRQDTDVSSRDLPDTIHDKEYSKRTDAIAENEEKPQNINNKALTCKSLGKETIHKESEEIIQIIILDAITIVEAANYNNVGSNVKPKVLSIEQRAMISNTGSPLLNKIDKLRVNCNSNQDDGVIKAKLFMPTQKIEELCPLNGASNKMEEKYNYSNTDVDEKARKLLIIFINCVDPGLPDSGNNKSDINKMKEYILKKRSEDKKGQATAIEKNTDDSHLVNKSGKLLTSTPTVSTLQTKTPVKETAHDKEITAVKINPAQSIHALPISAQPLNSPPKPTDQQKEKLLDISTQSLRSSTMPKNEQRDDFFDMSKAFPQQISWGQTRGQTKQIEPVQDLPLSCTVDKQEPHQQIQNTPVAATNKVLTNTQTNNYTMWEHPLVPIPSSRNENKKENDELSNKRNVSETHHQLFNHAITATMSPKEKKAQNKQLIDLSKPLQPQVHKWMDTPDEQQTYLNESTINTETQQHLPLQDMYQNNYLSSYQRNYVDTGPTASQVPNVSNPRKRSNRFLQLAKMDTPMNQCTAIGGNQAQWMRASEEALPIEHGLGQEWTHGVYPASKARDMKCPYHLWMEQYWNQAGKPHMPTPSSKSKKPFTSLVQPCPSCGASLFKQNFTQSVKPEPNQKPEPCSSPHWPQYYSQNLKPESKLFWSTQCQEMSSRTTKSEPNQKPESYSSPQWPQNYSQNLKSEHEFSWVEQFQDISSQNVKPEHTQNLELYNSTQWPQNYLQNQKPEREFSWSPQFNEITSQNIHPNHNQNLEPYSSLQWPQNYIHYQKPDFEYSWPPYCQEVTSRNVNPGHNQNLESYSSLQWPQNYSHNQKPEPVSHESTSHFQQNSSQNFKADLKPYRSSQCSKNYAQKMKPVPVPSQFQSHGLSQLDQNTRPAPDSKTSDDVPLTDIIKMLRMRLSKSLKFFSAEEQIKALDMSNKCGNKKPPKCPSSSSPARDTTPRICPALPVAPPCPPKNKCQDPVPPRKKCNPCTHETNNPCTTKR